MKWIKKLKYKNYPDHGETRTIQKFLLWPVTINKETRWLEWTKYTETFYYGSSNIPELKSRETPVTGLWEKIE